MPSNKNNTKDNVRNDRKSSSKKKKNLPFGCSSRFTVCLIFCILACTAVFVSSKWDTLSPNGITEWFVFSSVTDEDFSIDISGTSIIERNLQINSTGLIYVSDTSIVDLNYDGSKKYSEQHNFTNPIIKTSDTYSIAYNAGGSNYRILSETGELYRGTQGSSITDCDITPLGSYAVISDQTGYLSILSVYDKDNNLIYTYSFNDYYAISVSLNESGTMAAVGAVNSVDGQLVSKVYVIDFSKTTPVNIYTYNDQIIYDVDFVSEDNFAVVTDSLISVISIDKHKEIPYSFGTRVLTAYDISYDTGIVLSLSRSDDGRDCSIISLDTSGNEINNFSTEFKVFSIDVKDDKIAFLSSNTLYLYNSYGDTFGEWEVGTDAKSLILPKKDTAYILGVSEIRKVDLK